MKYLILFFAITTIALCLFQSNKNDAVPFSNQNLNLFKNTKERGTEKMVTTATAVSGGCFILLVLIQKFM